MARLTAWPTCPRVIRGRVVNVLGNLVLTGTAIPPVLFVYAIVAAFEGEYLPAGIIAPVGHFLSAAVVHLLAALDTRPRYTVYRLQGYAVVSSLARSR